VKNGRILSSLLIGSSLPLEKGKMNSFYIGKNLTITIYNEEAKYNEKKEKREILYKKIVGIYQIEDDGSITKLE
jgi:hypothetical protein